MNRIADIRKERGLTQTDVGAYLGVTATAVSLYESGRRGVDLQTACALADLFDVSLDYLAGREYLTPYEKVYESLNQQGRESLALQVEMHRANPLFSKKDSQIAVS